MRTLYALPLLVLQIGCWYAEETDPSPTPVECHVQRDRDGRISRDEALIRRFRKETGYPRGRTGYVVDHIVPLCACGADAMHNLQWQRADSAKVKDKAERAQCRDMWQRGVDGE